MAIDPRAGQPAPEQLLIDVNALRDAYYTRAPDAGEPTQQVRFGTSGHRGSPLRSTFNEAHVLAITQAVCDYRAAHNITGPLFLGKDTHAVSDPAYRSAVEVLAANGVHVIRADRNCGKARNLSVPPTPSGNHADQQQ